METKTHFDLIQAIGNWQQELASQSQLSVEDQRELKGHLCDAVAELQKRGLDAEEAFWLARRRVGKPQELEREFVRANPTTIWRERVLWMAGATLLLSLWRSSCNQIFFYWASPVMLRFDDLPNLSQWLWQIAPYLWNDLPPLIFIFVLLRPSGRISERLKPLFQSRSRFVCAGLAWIALNAGLMIIPHFKTLFRNPQFHSSANHMTKQIVWTGVISSSAWALALVALIAWILPSRREGFHKLS